jgi:hypothetical protein
VEQGLEIRAGLQLVLEAERFDQLDVVVDLAVADDGRAAGVERLPAAFEVDDRQAGVGDGTSRDRSRRGCRPARGA